MKLSVIIPVYSQEELVIRALESIPNRKDMEIIVIDDASIDNTWNNLLEYRKNNLEEKNIVLLYNEDNKGVGYTVNKGYDAASGEYVVLLGSDDYFTDKFEESLNELDGTDLIYFNLEDNDGNIWEINKDNKDKYVGSVKFMRRDLIGDTRCPEIRFAEDLHFYQDLMKKNPTEKYLNIAIKHYNYPRIGSLSYLWQKGEL